MSNTVSTQQNIANISQVILPVIRRVLPTVIANDIIGVQPMTGPTGQIFSLRTRYGSKSKREYYNRLKIQLQPGHFKKFLRLYDRRKSTLHDDIVAANYPWIYVNDYKKAGEAKLWCIHNLGECGYIFDMRFSRFYFENREDCAMFTLTWL
jgi:Major capsid protein Gp23